MNDPSWKRENLSRGPQADPNRGAGGGRLSRRATLTPRAWRHS